MFYGAYLLTVQIQKQYTIYGSIQSSRHLQYSYLDNHMLCRLQWQVNKWDGSVSTTTKMVTKHFTIMFFFILWYEINVIYCLLLYTDTNVYV